MKAAGIATPSKFQHLNVKYYDELYTGNSIQDKKVKQISEELYLDPSFIEMSIMCQLFLSQDVRDKKLFSA